LHWHLARVLKTILPAIAAVDGTGFWCLALEVPIAKHGLEAVIGQKA
jgi:hypothetical protein